MPWLGHGIHVLLFSRFPKTWMPGLRMASAKRRAQRGKNRCGWLRPAGPPRGDPCIPRRRNSAIRLPDQPNARINKSADHVSGTVRRPIVDHHQPPVAVRLRQHRRNRVADTGGGIIRGNDNANAHATSVRTGGLRRGYASVLCSMPFSASSVSSSPDWNISVMMSQPPTNSPFT
jgi:hypothetical protein